MSADHDLPVPVPESEWTPWQRALMAGHERLHWRYNHQAKMVEWKHQQQRSREWVNFEDVADWCARKGGAIGRDEYLRAQAQHDLVQSVLVGEFSQAGRVKIAYLPESLVYDGPVRLRLQVGAGINWRVLENCWAPRGIWSRWFAARDIKAPPWLSQEQPIAESVKPETLPKDVEPETKTVCAAPPQTQASPASYRNKTGPKPKLRNEICARMIRDYEGRPDALRQEKQETLKSEYGASRDTIQKARTEALRELRQNPDITANIDK